MPLCSPVSPWLLGLVRAPENLKCKIQLKCQRIVNVILHQWILKVVASKAFQNRFTQQSVQKSIYHDSVYKLAENGKFLHLLIVNWIATVLEISQRFGLHHHSLHLSALCFIPHLHSPWAQMSGWPRHQSLADTLSPHWCSSGGGESLPAVNMSVRC